MKVLIIPDVHLKPEMFTDAEAIIKDMHPDVTICLGDLVDDWECGNKADCYTATLNAALSFEQNHPETLFCYGNHDLAYLWDVWCSGKTEYFNVMVAAVRGFRRLYSAIPEGNLAFVHRIDNVLFSHAGISRMFVREHFTAADYDHTDRIVAGMNHLRMEDMWNDDSPIWLRPQRVYQGSAINMYKPRTYLQVVGHSPMKEITRERNLLSCDVFSLCRDRSPYGAGEFTLLDTESWQWQGCKAASVM